jgi:hypothetical protein
MIRHSRICFYVGTFHRWIGQHFLSNEEYFLDEHLHLCKATNNEMMQRKESAISKGINVLPRRDEMYKYIKSTMKKEKNDRSLPLPRKVVMLMSNHSFRKRIRRS